MNGILDHVGGSFGTCWGLGHGHSMTCVSGAREMLKCWTGCCAVMLTGCVSFGDLPAAEQDAVLCAQRMLVSTPSVGNVEIVSGSRPIIQYTFLDHAGKAVKSRIRIDGWNAPGQPISYYYEIIDDEFLGAQTGHYDVRDLMSKCNLGQTVVTE